MLNFQVSSGLINNTINYIMFNQESSLKTRNHLLHTAVRNWVQSATISNQYKHTLLGCKLLIKPITNSSQRHTTLSYFSSYLVFL